MATALDELVDALGRRAAAAAGDVTADDPATAEAFATMGTVSLLRSPLQALRSST